MNIQEVINTIKSDFENCIRTGIFDKKQYENGAKAKEALIRSQKLIMLVHNNIKEGINNKFGEQYECFPPVGDLKNELSLEGYYKPKFQDISLVPKDLILEKDKIKNSERILTINVRSQLSSLDKNKDTLYERTFAEALNLHRLHSKQCLGEVYLIPVYEYDQEAMKNNKVAFSPKASNLELYIQWFQKINNRTDKDDHPEKYERICLLIVDFRLDTPKIYTSTSELIADGLLKTDRVTFDKLDYDSFFDDLYNIYIERFNPSQTVRDNFSSQVKTNE